jgi:hypothetical protein
MPKGHSTLEPQVMAVMEQNADLAKRVATLEAQIAQMMESFKNGNIPLQMAANYQSNFAQWPNAS